MLMLRAVLSFCLLPGVVAFLGPWLVLGGRLAGRTFAPAGALLAAPGLLLLLWCVVQFYRDGRGTLAPWDPPRFLVARGPYRWSRNPMYVGVSLMLAGWAVGFRSPALAGYAGVVMAAFQVRVVYGEEPWLARTFGDAWPAYRDRVPRWFGRAR